MKFSKWINSPTVSWRDVIIDNIEHFGFAILKDKDEYIIKGYRIVERYFDQKPVFSSICDAKKYVDDLIKKIEKLSIFE